MNKVIGALRVREEIEANGDLRVIGLNMVIGERELNRDSLARLVLRKIRVIKMIGALLVLKAIEALKEIKVIREMD